LRRGGSAQSGAVIEADGLRIELAGHAGVGCRFTA
jgi:hypothetical protein